MVVDTDTDDDFNDYDPVKVPQSSVKWSLVTVTDWSLSLPAF